ncbi:MAG: MerR family transcriptional regulator [Candidatus Hadarchaeaceae archaeon]
MEKMYTLKEAKEILRVCTKTIQRWDKLGKIKCIRTPGNRRLIPESEILRIIGKITPLREEKEEIKPLKPKIELKKELTPESGIKVEKLKIEETIKTEEIKKPALPETKIEAARPKEMTRYAILDTLEPPGLAIRSAFGDLLSAAILLKKFSSKDLSTKARCPEAVANMFCQRMKSLNYLTEKDGVFELQIEVVK